MMRATLCAFAVLASCSGPPSACTGSACDGGAPDGSTDPLPDAGTPVPDAGPMGCVPACRDSEQCVGQTCDLRYSGFIWLTPAAGGILARGASPLAVKMVLRVGHQRNDPSQIDVTLRDPDGGVRATTLSLVDAGTFSGSYAFDTFGSWGATADWPGSGVPQDTVSFTVEPARPVFRVTAASPPARVTEPGLDADDPVMPAAVWKRNDIASLRVTIEDGGIDPASVSLAFEGTRSDGTHDRHVLALDAGCVLPCPDAGPCWCATADLSAAEFSMLRGPMSLVVSGHAVGGSNVVTTSDLDPVRVPALMVTREAWRHRLLPAGTDPNVMAIVMDHRGRVIVHAANTGGAFGGSIGADGTIQWQRWLVDTGAPIIVGIDGGQALLAPVFTVGYRLHDLDTGDPIDAGRSFSNVNGYDTSLVPAEATDAGAPVVLSVMGSGFSVQAVAWNDELLSQTFSTRQFNYGTAGGGGHFGWFGGQPETVELFRFTGAQLAYDRSITFQFPLRQAAWLGDGFIGGGSVYTGGPGFVRFGPVGTAPDWRFPSGPSTYGSRSFVIGAPQVLFGVMQISTSETQLIRIVIGAGSTSATGLLVSQVYVAPALAAGGTLYTVGIDGSLSAFDTATLASRWRVQKWPLDVAASFTGGNWARPPSAPLLDCARDGMGTPQRGGGRLVVLSDQGTLYSVIIDEPGLDVQAPWPVHRHDPEGTNNAATDLAPFACP